MNNRFLLSLLEKLPGREKKAEKEQKEIEQKKKLEECVRKQAEELTEELNFRLLCLQLGEIQQEIDLALAKMLKKAERNQIWEFLRNTPDILWIEEISVIEIIYPENESSVKQLMNRVMSFITYKKS